MADAISRQAFSDLIGLIYDCALDPSRWERTLLDVGYALDCHILALHLTDLRHHRYLLNKAVGLKSYEMERLPKYLPEMQAILGEALASWPSLDEPHVDSRHVTRRIGMLWPYAEGDPEANAWLATFREELEKLGWVEGRNVRIDHRWVTLDEESVQRFARELVALQPDIILTQTTSNTVALLQQTRTIPIVLTQGTDPVGAGFVASLSRPGRQRHWFHQSRSFAGQQVAGWSRLRRLSTMRWRSSPSLPHKHASQMVA